MCVCLRVYGKTIIYTIVPTTIFTIIWNLFPDCNNNNIHAYWQTAECKVETLWYKFHEPIKYTLWSLLGAHSFRTSNIALTNPWLHRVSIVTNKVNYGSSTSMFIRLPRREKAQAKRAAKPCPADNELQLIITSKAKSVAANRNM